MTPLSLTTTYCMSQINAEEITIAFNFLLTGLRRTQNLHNSLFDLYINLNLALKFEAQTGASQTSCFLAAC